MFKKHNSDFKLNSKSLTQRLCVAGINLEENGVLTIERVKKDDEGLYECVASNVEGVAKTSAVVTVLGKSYKQINVFAASPLKSLTLRLSMKG